MEGLGKKDYHYCSHGLFLSTICSGARFTNGAMESFFDAVCMGSICDTGVVS